MVTQMVTSRIVKADLHNHLRTRSRMDGLFDRTVDVICSRLGEGGVIGLVNFEDRRYEDFVGQRGYERADFGNAVYVPEKDVLVVKGQEIPTKEGHLLVLGLEKNRNLKAWKSVEDTIEEARDNNGIIIADHPFYSHGLGGFFSANGENVSLLGKIDGFEVYNGEAALWIPGVTPRKANKRALDFYVKVRDLFYCIGDECPELAAPIVSSDGHSLYELGRSYTCMLMSKDYLKIESSKQVVQHLREGLRGISVKPIGGRKASARLGALDHFIDLALIIAARKVGIEL